MHDRNVICFAILLAWII